ncbi:FecR domain-containing protein [Mesorhizobium sp. B4-1-4]|uniref:FecR family protein n=1 Tax=Mesorhizobium sp. B4-1-4 TaxID=2589888 RepID=UPI0039AF1352
MIKTAVTGATGPLVVSAPVYRDERISTSNTGLGQFVFLDGTKLAVGWGSSVVIDKYVFNNENSVKNLTIRAAKGTFRWISGSSPSSAYQIVTPAGTIGVRGTAFDVHIAPNGKTAVVLLKGAARFCSGGRCRELKRRCDCVVATPSGAMTDVTKVNRSVLSTLGTSRALPFLTGNQQLSGGFAALGNCGLMAASQQEDRARPQQRNSPAPTPPSPPSPPSPPGPPDPPHGDTDDGNNGHGNDPGKHDGSNPGKSNGHGKGNGNGTGDG